MPWLFRFFLLSSFLLVSLVSLVSVAQESKLKQVGNVPVDILYAGPNGRLVLKDPRSDTLYLWEPKEQNAKKLFHWDLAKPNSSRFYGQSPSGQYLLLRDKTPLGTPSPNEIRILDLASENLDSFVIPEPRTSLHLPIFTADNQRYFISTGDSGRKDHWIFPFGEYLEDIQNHRVQPTGFYLTPIPEKDSLGTLFDVSFSPDGSEILLLTQQAKEILLPASPLRRLRAGGGSLRRVEIASGKITDYKLSSHFIGMEWVDSNTVLLMAEDREGIYSFNLDTQKSEVFIADKISDFKISSDFKWVWISSVSEIGNKKNLLIQMATQRKIAFQNVTSAFFTPDNQKLVVQREKTDKGKPYLEIALAKLLASEEDIVAISEEKDLAGTFGTSIPVWEIPSDPKLFAEKFEQTFVEKKKLADQGWDIYVTFKSKSREYFGFAPEVKNLGLDCELVSDKGEVISKYTPDDDAGSPESLLIPRTVAPGQVIRLGCFGGLDIPLPPLFSGVIKYRIHGYDKAVEGEVAVP